MTDPDRFFDRTTPGAHEWWYFDALSDDGRDALVIVWYAGLPFDPSYGVATLRHLADPESHQAPRALDHSAIGFSWYRDGKIRAYALNGHQAGEFRHRSDPFSVEVATSRFERDGTGYRLEVVTPSVQGKPIRAEVRFRPAEANESMARDLGTLDAPHDWILVAADCRVEGRIVAGGEEMTFSGRGYHDHNAGAEDLSVAMNRWEWGRVHDGPLTHIYYLSEPKLGTPSSIAITCRDGRPVAVREGLEASGVGRLGRNVFGVRHEHALRLAGGEFQLTRSTSSCLDDGPFYRRWLADFSVSDGGDSRYSSQGLPGIAELLDTRNLHRRLYNWMIPYRLRWPVAPRGRE